MLQSLKEKTLAIVDTETTGTSPVHNQIIELAILRVEGGVVVDTFRSLVRPERMPRETIESLTGISREELELAPSFEEVAADVSRILEGALFVAHNARFDYSFIKNEFRRLGTRYVAKTLDTVKLSRLLYSTHAHHALDDVIARHTIACAQRHRAFDDAKVLWEFLQILDKEISPEQLADALARAQGARTLPSGLSREMVQHLPHAPGVYIFYGADREVLYVGKSIDIKTRVLSHFSGDHTSGRELRMCAETADIEARETTGELSALFLESKLIKELEPTYNRALRKARQLALMVRTETPEGYRSVSVEYQGAIAQRDLPNILGVFRTKRQAKEYLEGAVREHGLCPKLLGLEKSKHACFQYQLQRCRGACISTETTQSYNKRFEKVFQKRRIRTWPYEGPIVVKDEVDEYDGTAFVIDNWCLIKTFSYSGDQSSEADTDTVEFDYDAYKILSKYLLKNEGRRTIEPYTQGYTRSFSERTIG